MEFSQKLQQLRKQKGITQEQLADAIFVSRTAVAKWEQGKGYPNIDSLKDLAKFFAVTIDDLLSSEQLLCLAQTESKQKQKRFISLVFGLIDLSVIILFFLPFFGQTIDGKIYEVSLIALTQISPLLKVLYFVLVISTVLMGIITLCFAMVENDKCFKVGISISLAINVLCALVFIMSKQPYASAFSFVYLIIKVILLFLAQRHEKCR